MKDIKARILSNKEIGPGYFKMLLDTPGIARGAKPGQFMQVRCSDGFDPLLRRPFSIHRIPSSVSRIPKIEILYEVIGKGTEVLSKKRAGEFLDVLGPLGNGFTVSRTANHPSTSLGAGERPLDFARGRRTTILVAGGIGVAPLVFLAEELARRKIDTAVLIGAKTKKLILCEKDFKKTGAEVYIATDDGGRGCKGFVSELFKKVLRFIPRLRSGQAIHESSLDLARDRRITTYACGPSPMLKCIASICEQEGLSCEVSLEERMACGFGVCLGCAVKVKGEAGYKLVCKDGPVFNAMEISWNER